MERVEMATTTISVVVAWFHNPSGRQETIASQQGDCVGELDFEMPSGRAQ